MRAQPVGDHEQDCLLYVFGGSGTIMLDGRESDLERGAATLVLAGEHGVLGAGSSGLAALLVTVAPIADRHAPMGRRELTTRLDDAGAESSVRRAVVPDPLRPALGIDACDALRRVHSPGRAPWHYHLYDEIVWVPEGPGRLHLEERTEELGPGSAFRLRPRQVHIVENLSADRGDDRHRHLHSRG